MCGIAGTTRQDEEGRARVIRLLSAMQARGPDGSGLALGSFGALGMCRLRVRGAPDVSVPFMVDDHGSRCAYNGEIYAAGPDGAMPQDGLAEARVIALDTIGRVDGMYASAYTAPADGSIVLRRDPRGIKPLFYHTEPGGVTFASELGALVTESGAGTDADLPSLGEYLLFGRMLGRRLPYSDVREVEPGESVRVSERDCFRTRVAPANDWTVTHPRDHTLATRLRESVIRCAVTERTLGVAVSGGIDSTIVAHVVCEAEIAGVRTFSVVVEGEADSLLDIAGAPLHVPDNREWIHTTVPFGPADLVARLPSCVRRYAQPFRMTSVLLYDALAEAVHDAGCTVLLTGEGADELFLGYSSYIAIIGSGADQTPFPLLHQFYLGSSSARLAASLLPRATRAEVETRFDSWAQRFANLSPTAALRSGEQELSLEPLLLRADVMMMARSIEVRTPFLHGGIPETADALHRALPLRNEFTKPALRTAFPGCTRGLAKTPFRLPLARWFAGTLREWIGSECDRAASCLGRLGFRRNALRAVFRQAQAGDEAAASVAFRCTVMCRWLEDFSR